MRPVFDISKAACGRQVLKDFSIFRQEIGSIDENSAAVAMQVIELTTDLSTQLA